MKKIEIFLLLISIFLPFQNSEINSNLNKKNQSPKIKCSADKIKHENKVYELTEEEEKNVTKKRNLQDIDYKEIRIYLSYVQLTSMIYDDTLLNQILDCLNKTNKYVQNLIKVKRLDYRIKFSFSQQKNYNLTTKSDNYDTSLEAGVEYDLVIFPIIITTNSMSCKIIYRDRNTYRPIISILYIPNNLILKTGKNIELYFRSLLLHEYTHILGFLYDSFEYFPGSYNRTIEKGILRDRERYFIKTDKVVQKLKQYYNCYDNDIIGLELEDQDDSGLPSSHWEARILLGEYMNIEQYRPEVVISDFTLALLEDSDWYRVNNYTGGLMRFGKNKGCDFFFFLCSDVQGKTPFKNEFFDFGEDDHNPSCSSGRISRTYSDYNDYQDGIPISKYSRIGITNKENCGGKTKNADYCFGFIQNSKEETDEIFYVGNCNYGNGSYGSQITYNYYGNLTNSKNEKELKEKYSNNSFCILSEAYPSNLASKYQNIIHPLCYEMFCSNESLTVKIGEQYIVCPRGSGKVQVFGDFQGFIYCPDYNLICTGEVPCNDMFDCIDKKSTSKTSFYDYPINENTSSQKLSVIKDFQPIIGYEKSENGKCPKNCSQCKDNKKCYKCPENYNLIGVKENDDHPIICDNTTNITYGYFQKNNVFYPCIEFCNNCSDSYTCDICDNKHKLNSNKTICIDKVESCELYDNINYECIKCKNGYSFLKEDKENCLIISNKETKYFTLDNGTSYYPCDTNISNCDECENKSNECSKCKSGYYFIEANRTYCFNNIEIENYYYTTNNGISYIRCNNTIEKCQNCTYNNINRDLKCNLCEKNYYFFQDNRYHCFNNYSLTENYLDDNGRALYPCYKEFPQCKVCNNNKTKCDKCFDGYYFVGLKKDKCENNIEKDKYFTEDNGISYIPCDETMEGCEKCLNRTYCTLCKNNYYFIEKQRNKCYYNINQDNYYKEGDDYFPCNKSIENCNICDVKDSCKKCNDNYYFIGTDYKNCVTGKNLKKYYSNDNNISYFPCNTTMEHCDECYNDHFCYLCQNLYFLIFENDKECFYEENLKKDKSYFRLNATHYKKCSDNILNCNICSSSQDCDQCLPNNYFVDDDSTKCVNIMDINIEEYYEYNKYNYHTCSWLFDNCKKCNSTACNFCYENFTLVNDNYKKCQPKENYQIGYYQNQKGNMFYSCIDNCDICTNGIECIQCTGNYSLLGDRTSCGLCMIVEVITKDELSIENKDKYVQSYIDNYGNNYDVAMVYSNPNLNLTLTIFRTWQCTELLLIDKYYRLNINEFIEKLKKKLNKSGKSFIYTMMNYNYKSYFEVYDIELDRTIDIQNECQECLRIEYEIKNNYTSEISHVLGNKIYKLANNYNINVLNSSDPYYNEICKNVIFESIDISVEQRRKIFYLGNKLRKLTCLDDECTLNSIFYNESIGICQCNFNFDFDNLLINSTLDQYNSNNEDLNSLFSPISGINPLPIFMCSEETFNPKTISSNIGLYIGGVTVIIQIICFLVLVIRYCLRKKIVKNIASPPPKEVLTLKKKHLFKDDTEKETQAKDKEYVSYFDSADTEKKVQDKDEDEFDYDLEDSNNINSKYYKNTQVLSEEHSYNSERKNNEIFQSQRKLNEFNFEKIEQDEGENNFSKISEIKRKNTEELDYSNLSKKTSNESLDLSEDEIFSLIKNNRLKLDLDYTVLSDSIKKDERTFCEFYMHLLALKQPILDMISEIKALELNSSFVPLSMKIIRFFFMLSLNMFMNTLFLTQKYFEKKYIYFNNKYNLQYNENIIVISSNEKFVYAIKNTIIFSVCTFFICLVLQFFINYYLFNVRKKVWIILKECDDKKEEIKEMNIFFNNKNCNYILIFFINFVFMLFFFFYIMNFSQAYKGGILDYVAATLMTWIFLQVIPFISCLISALLRYLGLKRQNNRLYKLNQVYIY